MSVELEVVNAEEVERQLLTELLGAQTRAVHAATRRLEKDFEGLTRAAVKGNAWRAWRSRTYPRGGGPAYEPQGMVFGNGGQRTKGMLSYWSLPGTNRAKRGEYLAIPLAAARGTSRGKAISPREWEIRFGAKLRPLFRPGKAPLLVADGAVDGRGNFIKAAHADAKIRGGQNVRRLRTVAVFVLLDAQPHANKIALAPAVGRAREYMIESFRRRVAAIGN